MNLQLLGCNHRRGSTQMREKLTIPTTRLADTLSQFGSRFPAAEAVLLSTCNRVEIYTATGGDRSPLSPHEVASFLADVQGLDPNEVIDELFQCNGKEAARHLFSVAASLDSMVVGEPQILSQVKQAYELATQLNTTGQYTHAAFQRALFVAKRVLNETELYRNRVSIPSVAIREFAKQIFERFEGKQVLTVGAGEMAKETLRCLVEEGADTITIVNRTADRAAPLAARFGAKVGEWDALDEYLIGADLVICATGAERFVIDQSMFEQVAKQRHQRPMFLLVDPEIGKALGVYLYSVDDLSQACDNSLRKRAKQLPHARKIVEEESERFMLDIQNRSTGPIIRRLKEQAADIRDAELERLLAKMEGLDPAHKMEIEKSFRRLVNKLLHPPLESLRVDPHQSAPPDSLLDALKKLFQLRD
jgi:glutamyl-tRNA reductase